MDKRTALRGLALGLISGAAVAVIDQSGIGESFDLIIGVDGRRVRHILDFQDLTSNVRPGDTVYLTIVRGGRRVQLPVQLPATSTAFRN